MRSSHWAGLIGIAASFTGASGVTLPLSAITSNGAASVAQGLAGISVTVSEVAGGVRFGVSVGGLDAMSVAQIYWDNSSGVLGSISLLDPSGPGVVFVVDPSPGNLPSGNNVGFTEHFEVRALPPPSSNGINPGESLGVEFSLAALMTFSDVSSALSSGGLRIGMHVTSFANGQSEAFVNLPPEEQPVVPLPSAGALCALGLGAAGSRRRR